MEEEIFWRNENTECGFLHYIYLTAFFEVTNSKELFLFTVEPKNLKSENDCYLFETPIVKKDNIIDALNNILSMSLKVIEDCKNIIAKKREKIDSSLFVTMKHNQNMVEICKRTLHNVYNYGYILEEKQW